MKETETKPLSQLIEELCRKDSPEAYDSLSERLKDKANTALIIDMLLPEVRKGSAPAMVLLGNAYLNGWGVMPDIPKALDYARRAASLGNAGGEVLLGFLYANGYGVVNDYKRALHWFTSALQKNHSMAFNNLGVMYEQGLGVKKDIKQALKHYQQAASQNNVLAIKNLQRLS